MTRCGDVILKLVNIQATAQPLRIDLQGSRPSGASATAKRSPASLAVNTVAEPRKVVPKPFTMADSSASFTHELPAHSVTVIRLKTR